MRICLFAVLLLSTLGWFETPAIAGPVTYIVSDTDSFMTTGCVLPCACPQLIVGTVSGTFVMSEDAVVGGSIIHEIESAQLTVNMPSGGTTDWIGFGDYIYDAVNQRQRIVLHLVDSTGASLDVDSGLVPEEPIAPFPSFLITAETGTPCMATFLALRAGPAPAPPSFQRGDCNDDGTVNLADAVALLTYLFPVGGATSLDCLDACDGFDDGSLSIGDAVAILNALFGASQPLPPPYLGCGPDPTADGLYCALASHCP